MCAKVALVTGATSGIGQATALSLAKQGAIVVLHGRDNARLQQVHHEIIKESGNSDIHMLTAELLSQSEIVEMAMKFKKQFRRLDILVNNAGGMMGTNRSLTAEGKEETMALNLFAPYLLSVLLIDELRKGRDSRIINVSSSVHKLAQPELDDLQMEQHYSPLRAYANAKLFLILMSKHFAEVLLRHGFNNVTVNTMNPGAVATNFHQGDHRLFFRLAGKLMRPFFKKPNEGADTVVFLACSEKVKGITGQYFENRKPAKISQKYSAPEIEEAIWNYCQEQTGGYLNW